MGLNMVQDGYGNEVYASILDQHFGMTVSHKICFKNSEESDISSDEGSDDAAREVPGSGDEGALVEGTIVV